MYVSLELAKAQCNVDSYNTSEDAYITFLIDACERKVGKLLREKKLEHYVSEGDLPSDIVHAILYAIAYSYKNRESEDDKLDLTIERNIWSYIGYERNDSGKTD
ncbi:MAG: head-tail connector protein [Tannerellaceae bacterium]|jgi:hypothetical protein|nr:head-tail connector protein [Tannerellaceae bacterium]